MCWFFLYWPTETDTLAWGYQLGVTELRSNRVLSWLFNFLSRIPSLYFKTCHLCCHIPHFNCSLSTFFTDFFPLALLCHVLHVILKQVSKEVFLSSSPEWDLDREKRFKKDQLKLQCLPDIRGEFRKNKQMI